MNAFVVWYSDRPEQNNEFLYDIRAKTIKQVVLFHYKNWEGKSPSSETHKAALMAEDRQRRSTDAATASSHDSGKILNSAEFEGKKLIVT